MPWRYRLPWSGLRMVGLGLCLLVALAAPARAVLVGTFTGVITAGLDPTQSFGLPDLTGLTYTGAVTYDPDAFAPVTSVAGQYDEGEKFGVTGLISMSLTINGQTRSFAGDYYGRVTLTYPGSVHGFTGVHLQAHPSAVSIDRIVGATIQVISYTVPFLDPDGGFGQTYSAFGLPSSAWFVVRADAQSPEYQINMSVAELVVGMPEAGSFPLFATALLFLVSVAGWRRRPHLA